MRVCLLRHGIAAERDAKAPAKDGERPLTPKGIRRTKSAAAGLLALGILPDRILASPYVRALETARLALRLLVAPSGHGREGGARLRSAPPRPPVTLETYDALLPDRDPAELLSILSGLDANLVLCVGHAPHLDRMLLALLGLRRGRLSPLRKAGAALVSFRGPPQAGRGMLEWHLPSRVLRRLGERKQE